MSLARDAMRIYRWSGLSLSETGRLCSVNLTDDGRMTFRASMAVELVADGATLW